MRITQHKQGEEALPESEERFRAVANSAPEMIRMSDLHKLCNFFNKGWLEFAGRSLEQETGGANLGATQGGRVRTGELRFSFQGG